MIRGIKVPVIPYFKNRLAIFSRAKECLRKAMISLDRLQLLSEFKDTLNLWSVFDDLIWLWSNPSVAKVWVKAFMGVSLVCDVGKGF